MACARLDRREDNVVHVEGRDEKRDCDGRPHDGDLPASVHGFMASGPLIRLALRTARSGKMDEVRQRREQGEDHYRQLGDGERYRGQGEITARP